MKASFILPLLLACAAPHLSLGDAPTVKGSALPVASSVTLTDRVVMVIDPGGTPIMKAAALTTLQGVIGVADDSVTSAKIVNGAILNADINASAAIAYSKLALTGAILNADLAGSIAYSKLNLTGAILNADISASAAIAYSKLNLATSIVNADISASAAIAMTKLAALTASRLVVTDASGNFTVNSVTSTEAGYLSGVTSSIQTQINAKLATATAASTYQPLATPLTDLSAAFSANVVLRHNGTTWVADGALTSNGSELISTGTISAATMGTGNFTATGTSSLAQTVTIGPDNTDPGLLVMSGGTVAPQIRIYEATGTGSDYGILTVGALGAIRTWTLPNVSGTIITTGDSGTVTNTMLAGSIAASKITNTAAVLTTNTFTGAQMIDGSADAIQLLVQGNATQTSDTFVVENSAGTNALAVSGTGAVSLGGGQATPLSIVGSTATVTFTSTGDGSLLQSHSLILPANGYIRIGFTGGTDPILTASASLLSLTQAALSSKIILQTAAAPSGAGDTGTAGEVRYDGSYLYICTATNTWTRIALAW